MREGYKKTEVGVIPDDWDLKTIDDVVFINPESLNNATNKELLINYIDIESVKTGKILGTKDYTFGEAPSRARRIVKFDDVIVSTVRPNLKAVATVKENIENLVCSTGFAVLRNKDNLCSKFLYQYALSDIFTSQLVNKTVGSNYPAVNTSDIKGTYIIVPPLKEQEKIAEILSTVDSQIDDTEKLIEKSNELKKGLMKKLLTKGIGHSEFKKTEVGEIPASWEVKKFKDVSKINQGLQIAIEERFKEKSDNRLPYITIQYINDKNNKDNEFYIENASESVICTEDEILMTRTGNTGQVVTNEHGVFHNNFFKIDFDRKVLDKDYLVYYLKSRAIQSLIMRYAGTTTIPDLKHSDFYRIPVVLPSIYEQKSMSKILTTLDKEINEYKIKKEKLEELKKGLMQQLLTGSKRSI